MSQRAIWVLLLGFCSVLGCTTEEKSLLTGSKSDKNEFHVRLREERARNTLVVDLRKLLKNSTLYSTDYRLAKSDDRSNYYFSFDKPTGEIRTYKRIDRESLCSHFESCCENATKSPSSATDDLPQCHLTLNFVSGANKIKVIIHIEDVNDNRPKWKSNSVGTRIDYDGGFGLQALIVGIRENQPPNSVVLLGAFTDDDFGLNDIAFYRLYPDTSLFKIDWKINGSSKWGHDPIKGAKHELRLLTNATFDRESRSSYSITLTAFDGGLSTKHSSVKVNIDIEDENDHAPVFSQSKYSTELPSFSPVGYTIPGFKVNATDRDTGENADIRYRCLQPNSEWASYFRLSKKRGSFKIKKELPRDKHEKIELIVVAEDSGQPPLTATCTVELELLPINKHEPQIIPDSKLINDIGIVRENEAPGHIVGTFKVTDSDVGISGEVDCQMKPHDLLTLKEVPSDPALNSSEVHSFKQYEILTKDTLDYEKTEESIFEITCSDKGKPQKSTSIQFDLMIEDVNDNPPKFQRKASRVKIAENTPVGTSIFSPLVEDADSGSSGLLTYRLSGIEADYFRVNDSTGQVFLNKPIDRELKPFLEFTLTVTDHGEPPLEASSDVIVIVTDINDHVPEIECPVRFEIYANHSKAQPIGTIRAIDFDQGPSGYTKFSVIRVIGYKGTIGSNATKTGSGVSLDNKFTITQEGKIYLYKMELDRTKFTAYHLTVKVFDSGLPPLSTKCDFWIEVLASEGKA